MIVTITPQNFRTELIDASMQKPVAVYFYADELPECRAMTPQVEQLIGPNNPSITLAKVDVTDPTLQSLAVQLGLQALPALVLFRNGQPVDALMGPQEPGAIQAMLAAYLPREEDLLLDEARQQLADGQAQPAYRLLKQAQGLAPARSDIKLALARACLDTQHLEETAGLLDGIPMVDQDSTYHQLRSELDLAVQASDSPELKALETQLAQDPDNILLRQELAVQYSQAGRKQEALELLYVLLSRDLNQGDAKKIYLDILATLSGDPLAAQYRRKLYSLLY